MKRSTPNKRQAIITKHGRKNSTIVHNVDALFSLLRCHWVSSIEIKEKYSYLNAPARIHKFRKNGYRILTALGDAIDAVGVLHHGVAYYRLERKKCRNLRGKQ